MAALSLLTVGGWPMKREAGGGAKGNLNPPTVEDGRPKTQVPTTKQTVNIQWMNELHSGEVVILFG